MSPEEKLRGWLPIWRKDWCLFAEMVLHANLDDEQKDVLRSVQFNPRTAVASGTSRGKDFVAAVAALCFLYLTPTFDEKGKLVGNTKVALTAPTARQVDNIMAPEFTRLFRSAGFLPGRLVACDIRTEYDEWFLTGFKADDKNEEAWSGFHAVNTMFVVTEASGISEKTFKAIEGNLQGNSRLLIVFNPNTSVGYAARAMKSSRFKKFRLNSLKAANVVSKKIIYPGQVDYEWVKDKVESWCTPIKESDYKEEEGDFKWEGHWYRPNDTFRIKVLGLFPKAGQDMLIPQEWIEKAVERWKQLKSKPDFAHIKMCRLGVDVAGMGRDSSVLCPRYGNFVDEFDTHQSAGQADHMHVAGMIARYMDYEKSKAFIDTIGEGAGVYSRLLEEGYRNVFSCKFSEGAKELSDMTDQYTFVNMKAYLYWAVRDWLDPKNGFEPALPECDQLIEEATEIKWKFTSSGSIAIEKKEDLIKRLGRSTDYFDALANTFYPHDESIPLADLEAFLGRG